MRCKKVKNLLRFPFQVFALIILTGHETSPVPLHHVISAGALVYTLVWKWGRLLRNGWDVRE